MTFMSRHSPSFVWVLAIGGAISLGPSACSDSGCATCVDGVNPSEIIDPGSVGDGSGYPGEFWPMAPKPSALGWSEKRLGAMTAYADQINSDGFLVVHGGVVVWTYGNTSRNLIVQSCRKSFLSALYGIYHDAGMVDLEATMEELGIDDLPPSLTSEEKQARVEHLLKARSGVYHEAAAESQSMKDARPPRGSHSPGTFWYYNNWDFNVLGTLFLQLSGEDIFQALHEELAVPLQMQDFRVTNGIYHFQEMSEHPAYHFSMSPRDMARFGLLVLREGRWRDQQLISEDWVRRMLVPYSDAGSTWDYGFMWWIGEPEAWDGHTVYAALGGSGQAIFVVEDLDVVIAHKVDNSQWTAGWSEVNNLVRGLLSAKVF